MGTNRRTLAERLAGGTVSRYECEDCGLAAMDLPDGVDPELIFKPGDDGVMRDQGCQVLTDGQAGR